MRILHVTPYFEEAWGYGGIPRVVSVLAHAQAKADHMVSVCTTDARDANTRTHVDRSPSRRNSHLEIFAFRNVSNRIAYHAQFFTPVGLHAWLHRNLERFDVVHIHGHHHLLSVMASQACRQLRVPYLVSPHGTAPRIERRKFAKLIFDVTLGRGVIENAIAVACVSSSEKADLIRMGIDASKLEVVANPVDLSEFDKPLGTQSFRAQYAPGSGLLVAMLGRLTPRKEVATLLRAFAEIRDPNARLILAGNGSGVDRGISALAGQLGIGGQVIRLGQLERHERFLLLASSDVVAYPSRNEVFGLVAVESLLCRTPVVVANDSGCGELVAEVGGGLTVPPGDSHALAKAIAEISHSLDQFRIDAGRAAQVLVAKLCPDRAVMAFTRLYERGRLRAFQ